MKDGCFRTVCHRKITSHNSKCHPPVSPCSCSSSRLQGVSELQTSRLPRLLPPFRPLVCPQFPIFLLSRFLLFFLNVIRPFLWPPSYLFHPDPQYSFNAVLRLRSTWASSVFSCRINAAWLLKSLAVRRRLLVDFKADLINLHLSRPAV